MRSEDNSERKGIRANAHSCDFLLEFDTSHREFQRGFECGEIWACLTDEVAEITAIVSAENSEMVMRMTDATGYSFEGRYLQKDEIARLDIGDGEWLVVVMRADDERGSSSS
jgi:hypothetical protein